MMILNLNKFLNRILFKTCFITASASTIRVKTNYLLKRHIFTSHKRLFIKTRPLNFEPKQRKTIFNSSFYKLAKYLFVLEAAVLIATYLVWKRMNTSLEFRFYMSKNFPIILEGKI
jgi:hypothetical protein